MDANSQYELYLIKRELQNIINELDSISQGIQNDFSGIGNEQCAACVRNVAEKYRYVKRRLNNIDTSKVTASFAASHGNAGGGKVY